MPNERTRRAWQGLAAYANSVSVDIGGLKNTISHCMPWSAASDPWGLLAVMRSEWLEEQGVRYQPSVRALLLWLCGDSQLRNDCHAQALGFLHEHVSHIKVTLGEVPYSPDDPEHFEESSKYWRVQGEPKDDSPLGVYTPSKGYEDIADPICDFVLNEYQKYRNGEYKNPVPIFLCGNPSCKNLVMPQRIGRKTFCSDECKAAKQRQEIPQNEKTNYQWLYRLSKKTDGVKRAVLRSTEGKERLADIKARRYGPPCSKLVEKLGRFS